MKGPPPERMFQNYELLGELAPGRSGRVWLVRRLPPGIGGAGVCACLKLLKWAPRSMYPQLKRAALWAHRNAGRGFEVGFADDPFMIMEYLQGGSLRELRRNPRLIAGIEVQVRACMRAAHEKDIVHGALSADDVYVTTEGRAVILGFSTARMKRDAVP